MLGYVDLVSILFLVLFLVFMYVYVFWFLADATGEFKTFLEKEFSDENLSFWIDCERYKQTKPTQRRKMANRIFDRFMSSESSQEVAWQTFTE